MAFPDGVQTVTVTGRVTAADGEFFGQHVTFEPSVDQIVSTDLNLVIDSKPIRAHIDIDTGIFSVALIATDASGFNPTGWTYTVTRGSHAAYSISLPADTPTVELADLTPVTADTTVYDLIVPFPDVQDAIDTAVEDAVAAAVPPEVQSAVLTYPGLTTGVMHGGSMDPHPTDTTAVLVQPLRGYIVNTLVDPPTLAEVITSSPITVQLDAPALARAVTWFFMDSNQNVTMQEARPTATQQRTHLVIGYCVVTAGAVDIVQTIPTSLQQPTNQLYDLIDAIGSFNISGNYTVPNGSNLFLNHQAGRVFYKGINYYDGPDQTNDPHTLVTTGESPSLWRHLLRGTTLTSPSATSTIDVSRYDNAGTLTSVTGGTNSSTNMRLWIIPDNDGTERHFVQYGQTVHSSLALAVAAVAQSPTYVTNPRLVEVGILIGYLSVIRTATNLSDTSQAVLTQAGRFRNL